MKDSDENKNREKSFYGGKHLLSLGSLCSDLLLLSDNYVRTKVYFNKAFLFYLVTIKLQRYL